MGFLSSLFGYTAANAIRETQKEQKRVNNWNNLYDEMDDAQQEFNNFAESIGLPPYIYYFDVEVVNKGRSAVNAEKQKLAQCKNKINQFINMGGKIREWMEYDKFDTYIEGLRYLISVDCLYMQDKEKDILRCGIDYVKTSAEIEIRYKKIAAETEAKMKEAENRKKILSKLEKNMQDLTGIEFEEVCKILVEKMGFTTQLTKASGDGGIDIVAYNKEPLLAGKYIIQCKRYTGSVGEPIIRDLYGVVMSEGANKGILMTTGYFTNPAVKFAEGKPIELIDGVQMDKLLTQYDMYSKNSHDSNSIPKVENDDELDEFFSKFQPIEIPSGNNEKMSAEDEALMKAFFAQDNALEKLSELQKSVEEYNKIKDPS